MKTCSKCGHDKFEAEFSSDARAAGGLRSDCKDCCRVYAAGWRAKNPDKQRELINKWRAANPVQSKQLRNDSMRKSYSINPEKHRQRSREWASENKGVRAANQSRRRAKGICSWVNPQKVKEIYEFAHEFRNAGFNVEVDHIEPLQGKSVCGLHVEHNLRVCLADVNRSKGNRQMEFHQ